MVDWDALCKTPDIVLVPFGKYKGRPLQVLLRDKNYCKWLAAKTDIRTTHPNIYAAITGTRTSASTERRGGVRATIDDVMGDSIQCRRSFPCVVARCSVGRGVSDTIGGQHKRSVWRAVLMLDARCSCGNKHFAHPDDLAGRAP